MLLRSSRLAAVLAAALVASLTGAQPGAAAEDDDGLVPMRIGTYNFRADRSLEAFQTAVDELKTRVAVAGLQEIAQRAKNDHLMADASWGYYRPPELRQNPVIWDTAVFAFAEAPDAGYRIARGRTIESKTGGTEDKGDSYATVVRLEHLPTGTMVSIINVHLLSGASRVGRPWPGRPLRFELLVDQVRGTVRVIKTERALGHEVFILGDFNVGFQADLKVQHEKLPYRRYQRLGFSSMWDGGELEERGSFDNAYLDQVWSRVEPVSRRVAYDIEGSDHYPVIATY